MSTLAPLVPRSAGLDVHQKSVVACLLWEAPDGTLEEKIKEFTTYPDQLQALAEWLKSHAIDLAIMESTGVYWKSVFEILEESGLKVHVVNARHAKQMPGRKTDISDSR